MPTGSTTTDALQDSLPTVKSEARIVREHEGVMQQLVDKYTLGKNIGNTWEEVSLAQLTAQTITETTELDNPQQLSDALFQVTPTDIGLCTFITDRVAARISKNSYARTGSLVQNAIERKKDLDGITVLDGATTSLCGTGTTLSSGYIRAAVSRIQTDANEPGIPPFRCVLHGYGVKDIEDELLAGVGTYPVGEGLTARVFAEGFKGMIGQAQVYIDGNITVDSTPDAKGGVFSQQAIVLIQGRAPRIYTKFDPALGGGGNYLYHYDEYAYGERSVGNWLYEIFHDATAPTS